LRFERGLGQVYEQPGRDWLDASIFKEDETTHNLEQSYFPVVIVLQVGRFSFLFVA
jgi:hypothetical protein